MFELVHVGVSIFYAPVSTKYKIIKLPADCTVTQTKSRNLIQNNRNSGSQNPGELWVAMRRVIHRVPSLVQPFRSCLRGFCSSSRHRRDCRICHSYHGKFLTLFSLGSRCFVVTLGAGRARAIRGNRCDARRRRPHADRHRGDTHTRV
jgi:hypothetical protein